MKKSIIALAVASASLVSVAQADNTTLYGSVEGTYTWSDSKGAQNNTNFANTEVNVGIKGSDNFDGLTAFYDFKLVDDNDSKAVTEAKIGLKGNFGTVVLGHVDAPTAGVGKYVEQFEELDDAELELPADELDNTIAYVSPDFNGVTFAGGVVFDEEQAGKKRGVDAYDVAVTYNANGFHAGLGVQGVQTHVPGSKEHGLESFKNAGKVLAVGYGNDQFEVGYKTTWFNKLDAGRFIVAGKYNITPDASVYADVASTYKDTGDNLTAGLGYKQKFGKTTAFAEYRFQEAGKDDVNKFALGANHEFSKRTEGWAKYTFTDENNRSDIEVGLKTSF